MYLKEKVNHFNNHIYEISKYASDEDIERAEWYPSYFINLMSEEKISIKDKEITCYSLKFNDYRLNYQDFRINIEIYNNSIYFANCSCSLFKNSKKCYHLAATFAKYSDTFFHDKIDDSFYYSKLLNRYVTEDNKIVKKEVNLQVKLYSKVLYDDEYSKNGYSFELKVLVGLNKMYSLLNHFNDFWNCYHYERGKSYFGKEFEYDSKSCYFSNQNDRLINLLYQNGFSNKSYNLDSYINVIDFLEFNKIPFYFNDHYIEYINTGFPLMSNIKKDGDKYIISFNIDDIVPLCENYKYVYYAGSVYSLSRMESSLLEDIYDNDFGTISVKKEELSTFTNGLLKLIKNNVTIDDSAKDDISVSVLTDSELYFDISKNFIKLKIMFDYRGNKIDYFDNNSSLSRDVEKENEVISDILGYGFIENGKKFILSDLDKEVELIENGFESLAEKYRVFTTEKIKSIQIRKKTSVSSIFSIGTDNIFSYNFDLDNIKSDELVNIFKNMNEKKKYYRLKNGDILNLDDENLKELQSVSRELDFTDEEIINGKGSIQKYRAFYLDSLKSSKLKYTKTDNLFDNFIKNFYEYKNSNITLPKEDLSILRDYQLTGVKWLYNIKKTDFGGILADEMGLGKTIQTIYYIRQILLEDKNAKFLIVVPTSLVYNWKHELDLFGNGVSYNIISGIKSVRKKLISEDKSIYVTSYGTLREDEELYKDKNFNTMIIDEAQNIKNYIAGITKVCKSIKADTKFALTGTPLENSPLELWSIFDYIMPGYLASSDKFKAKYKIKDFDEDTNKLLDGLNKQIAPFILRRRKIDVVKDLPEKFENNIYIDMTDEQKKIYAAELEKTKNEVENIVKSGDGHKLSFLILPLLTKLRQLCIDPKIIYPEYKGGSNKIESLVYSIRDNIANGNKVLMFTSFKEAMNEVAEKLKEEDIPFYTISGEVSAKDRMDRVNDFNNRSDAAVFLIMLKAGGTGLNLTSASTVIHLDLWWNPQAENQATDRAHRIGQTKTVEVVHIICKGTIEEKILELQKKKLQLSEKLIDGQIGNSDILSSLSEDDIRNLLSNENKD